MDNKEFKYAVSLVSFPWAHIGPLNAICYFKIHVISSITPAIHFNSYQSYLLTVKNCVSTSKKVIPGPLKEQLCLVDRSIVLRHW